MTSNSTGFNRRNVLLGGAGVIGAAVVSASSTHSAYAQTNTNEPSPTVGCGRLIGKVVFITGAGRGIGRSTAVAFAEPYAFLKKGLRPEPPQRSS